MNAKKFPTKTAVFVELSQRMDAAIDAGNLAGVQEVVANCEAEGWFIDDFTMCNPLGRNQHWTPLIRALNENQIEIARFLLPWSDLDPHKGEECEAWEPSPLQMAIQLKDLSLVRLFLNDEDFPKGEEGKNVESLVGYAVGNGTPEIAAELLRQGWRADIEDNWRRTPLMRAVSEGLLEFAQAMGPLTDLSWKNSAGQTAFDCAVESGQWRCAETVADMKNPKNIRMLDEILAVNGPEAVPFWAARAEAGELERVMREGNEAIATANQSSTSVADWQKTSKRSTMRV